MHIGFLDAVCFIEESTMKFVKVVENSIFEKKICVSVIQFVAGNENCHK